MAKQTYSELLKNPLWQRRRLEIMKRDRWKCRICGDNESTLHVHHIEYNQGLPPWKHLDDQLITLCEQCHHTIGQLKDVDYAVGVSPYTIKGYKIKHVSGGATIFMAIGGVIIMSFFDDNGAFTGGRAFLSKHSDSIISVFKAASNYNK